MSQSTVADLLKDKVLQSQAAPKRALFSIGPDVGVAEAVSSMAKNEISSMIVMETDEIVGLITLRELLQGLNAHGGNLMKAKRRNEIVNRVRQHLNIQYPILPEATNERRT